MNSNSTNPTPQNLAQSMAEEIRRELQTQLSGVENEPFSERVKIWKEAQEIIQRRIEPLVRVVEAAKELSKKCYCSDFPGLNPCPRCRVIEALSKL